ncbi:MAG: trypsin-like peptidase domain-containing protein [Chloroflexi bacterium]|nr:trypsin-like peptidase domain-containing protein [Chloroflexota bacterium]
MAAGLPPSPSRRRALAFVPRRSLLGTRGRRALHLALGFLPASLVLIALHAASLSRDGNAWGNVVAAAALAGGQAGQRPSVSGPPLAVSVATLSSAEVIANVRRSVVRLTVESRYGPMATMGSGFYIGDRLVVTTAHVLTSAQRITAQVDLGTRSLSAAFVGWDSGRDIALVRLEADPGVPPLALRPTERRATGWPVLAFGFPTWATAAEPSASAGIVSRHLEYGALGWVMETDAIGNSGADGGPVVDHTGAVVGMSQGWVTGQVWPVQLVVTADQILALLPGLKAYGGWGQD